MLVAALAIEPDRLQPPAYLGPRLAVLLGQPQPQRARRSKPGPPSKLERQPDAVAQLPRARQKFVSDMLNTVLAQHHGQEAATAS